MQKLLDLGADFNVTTNKFNKTLMMQAAELGRTDIIETLVQLGADVNEQDKLKRTAITYAIHNKQVEVK